MTSRADGQKRSVYDLLEDFFTAVLLGAVLAAVLVMIDATSRAVIATALGAPGVYFLGQRFRRSRARKTTY